MAVVVFSLAHPVRSCARQSHHRELPLKAPRGRAPPASRVLNGIPKLFFGQVFFGGLGHQGQKTHLFREHRGFSALPPKTARPTNHSFLENVWFFRLGTPGLQKTTWPTKPLRDPFEVLLLTPRAPPTRRRKRFAAHAFQGLAWATQASRVILVVCAFISQGKPSESTTFRGIPK